MWQETWAERANVMTNSRLEKLKKRVAESEGDRLLERVGDDLAESIARAMGKKKYEKWVKKVEAMQ